MDASGIHVLPDGVFDSYTFNKNDKDNDNDSNTRHNTIIINCHGNNIISLEMLPDFGL